MNVCLCYRSSCKALQEKNSSCAVDSNVQGVKKVRSTIKLCSYLFSYNVSYYIYVTGIL